MISEPSVVIREVYRERLLAILTYVVEEQSKTARHSTPRHKQRATRQDETRPGVCIITVVGVHTTYVPTPRRELGLLPAPGLGHTFREVLVGPLAESLKPLVEMTPVLGCTWPASQPGIRMSGDEEVGFRLP